MASIAFPTSAEVTPNGGLVRESSQNVLKSGLGHIVICPDQYLKDATHLEDWLQVSKWLGSPPSISHEKAIWKGNNPT